MNNLDIETEDKAVAYYKQELENDGDGTAITKHMIEEYNSNASKCGVAVRLNRETSVFEFVGHGGSEQAYRHRPVLPLPYRMGSKSHCGVEFIRGFDDLAERRFSRRMARKRFHIR
ncbi:MAG: hypothetical protein HYU38_02005 [Candidatus Tectomicrobia bacterium]|nr:hypothetical protein [Candidatus Tectomicrobia bacterium]